jgi:hypothetical protein
VFGVLLSPLATSQVSLLCLFLSLRLCSVPLAGVFDHTPLIVKEPDGEFRSENEWSRGGPGSENPDDHTPVEGSVETDLPMNQLSELFNVNHFIVSQVSLSLSSLHLSLSLSLSDHPHIRSIPTSPSSLPWLLMDKVEPHPSSGQSLVCFAS